MTGGVDSNLSSHTAERQKMMDGKTETKRAGGGDGEEACTELRNWVSLEEGKLQSQVSSFC